MRNWDLPWPPRLHVRQINRAFALRISHATYNTIQTKKQQQGETIMQKDYTHLIIVLDASGSMSSIQDDIKGSFDEFLKK